PRLGGGATALRDAGHLQDPAAADDRYLDVITATDVLRRLCRLAVHVHLAAVARVGRDAPRLEHARGPQPFVDAQRGWPFHAHGMIARMRNRAAVAALLILVVTAAWAADHVVVEDWASAPVGHKGI